MTDWSGLAIGVLGVALALPASADVLSTKGRAGVFASQTSVLDSRAAQQYNNSVRLKPPKVETPTKWGTAKTDDPALPRYRGKYKGPFIDMARAAARRNNVPEELFLRLINQESRFNAKAESHKGAIGLAQLMPGTARELGVDPRDPEQNLDAGARYLRQQYDRFGTWKLALAAYNAGPGAVAKYGGVPPFRETRNYVKKILGS